MFTAGSVVVSFLLAGVGFLGFQNVKGIAESVKREARSRIDGELLAFRETVNAAAELAVRTQAALRMAYLAEKWSESEDKRTLEVAIATAGERFRRHAAGDPDFAAMRASGALAELLKGVVAEEPDKSVPPVPKAPG